MAFVQILVERYILGPFSDAISSHLICVTLLQEISRTTFHNAIYVEWFKELWIHRSGVFQVSKTHITVLAIIVAFP